MSPVSGVLSDIAFDEGATVTADQTLGTVGDQDSAPSPKQKEVKEEAPAVADKTPPQPAKKPEVAAVQSDIPQLDKAEIENNNVTPSQRKHAVETGSSLEGQKQEPKAHSVSNQSKAEPKEPSHAPATVRHETVTSSQRGERRQKMTPLRHMIAQRLLDAQSEAAMLTTFNEINMDNIMNLRAKYKEEFEKKHGIKLGFMSLFTKAVCHALEQFPEVNASIDGQDIVYHDYCDISIAVSSPRGLVVPVVRNAHGKTLAQIESDIMNLSLKARDGQLSIEEMTGGTFTITNGGVFGSLMSTPILNPPQSAILGMHKIEKRPVVIDNTVQIAQMMYVALSYDHRIIDGRDSVQFLVAVKKAIEEPERLLLDI